MDTRFCLQWLVLLSMSVFIVCGLNVPQSIKPSLVVSRSEPSCYWLYSSNSSIWCGSLAFVFSIRFMANASLLGNCNLSFWWLQKCGNSYLACSTFHLSHENWMCNLYPVVCSCFEWVILFWLYQCIFLITFNALTAYWFYLSIIGFKAENDQLWAKRFFLYSVILITLLSLKF